MNKLLSLILLTPLTSLASPQDTKTEITPWNETFNFALTATYHDTNQSDKKWRETWTSEVVKTSGGRAALQFSYNAGYGRNACNSVVLPSNIELIVSGNKAIFSAWCDKSTASEFLKFAPLNSMSEATVIEAFKNNPNVVTFISSSIPELNFQLSTNNFETTWDGQ
ncbi:hypothetical protein QPI28_004471 [Vibrio parahaemolyticus]|uniref:hypothetical protein n=1 Tax=Vibrio parahaemolyticus TaxID=670 RepID=UPI00084B1511|nr:hypothetical protein [Vibrio parahaemolyticus]EKL5296966.1 hypothetical protein [Vibrio parahaemolyticus]ELA7176889.1 hypothetical protein [Vibrio parahaemolyticus]ELA7459472.1 hypothetical protein [Vibrio parahaemolyticus]ELA7483237.1 hypothetical protein [Vibrio parahaemolyticus]ELA7905800.1 hypothetical protein [Vibrio parahaemolyticus]